MAGSPSTEATMYRHCTGFGFANAKSNRSHVEARLPGMFRLPRHAATASKRMIDRFAPGLAGAGTV